MVSKVNTKALTALDLIKGLSMFVMMTDHFGYYFFPQELWFRSFGRIDFPVWFFLPGYSKSRSFEKTWLIGGLVLVAANILTGFSLLPLNAIFTIILIRVAMDRVMNFMTAPKARPGLGACVAVLLLPVLALVNKFALKAGAPPGAVEAAIACNASVLLGIISLFAAGRRRFWLASLAFIALFPLTRLFFEYGTLAIIIGVFGWLCRRKEESPDNDRLARAYGVFSWLAFSGLQQYMFQFDVPQFLLMSLGTGMYLVILYLYRPATFPEAASKVTAAPIALVRFLGRYTLEVYVFHLLLFKALTLWQNPGHFLEWHLFVGGAERPPA